MASLLPYLRLPLYILTSLTTLGTGALYWKQNELIYPRWLPPGCRDETGVPTPSQFGISDWSSPRIITPDGETLHTFLILPSKSVGGGGGGGGARNLTVVMFHGNAGNIGHRIPIAKIIAENSGCKVLMVEYRGYGLSTGTPDETGMVLDAQTALDWVRQSEECKGDGIVVYGQSIGGAVAVRLVAKNQGKSGLGGELGVVGEWEEGGLVKGLVLENTFVSMRRLIPSAFPPARYLAPLCHQTWRTDTFLPLIRHVPILMLSGLKDEIVPASHMKELRGITRSKDVTWREFPEGNHNETVSQPGYFRDVVMFLAKVGGGGTGGDVSGGLSDLRDESGSARVA